MQNALVTIPISFEVLSGGLAGDYNSDGAVDAADYVVWRKVDGSPSGYNLWRFNFGADAGNSGAQGGFPVVPEPSAFAYCVGILTFGAVLMRFRRDGRKVDFV